MATYSHSKISTFEQCKYKYKLKYIDKIKPEIEKSIEAHLGVCVHSTLEWLYLKVKENSIPTLDSVIEYYTEEWVKEDTDKMLLVKKEFTPKDYFNKGIHFLIDYYVVNQPFNEGTLELEKEIRVSLGEHQILGYIDRLSLNPTTGDLEIHDYKTANSLPTQDKLDQDRQLALYSIAIKELFGQEKKVKLIWHYLAHKKKLTSERTNEQLEKLKEEIIRIINVIEQTERFEPCTGILCNWCEYKPQCAMHNRSLKLEIQRKKESDPVQKEYPTTSKYLID